MYALLFIKYKIKVMENSRRLQPPLSEIKLGQLPPVEHVLLSNNIPLYLIEAGTEDIMRIEFVLKAGQINEYLPLIASTTNMMLTEGSQNYTAYELNSSLDSHGAFINLLAEKDNAGLVIFFLARHIRKIAELCFEILFKPVFPRKELDILMKKRIKWFQISREKVNNLSSDQFFESVFGKHHPYGRQINFRDFPIITTSILKDFHSRHYTPTGMAIMISGRIHPDTVGIMDHYFGRIPEKTVYLEPSESIIKGGEEKQIHIKKHNALQSSVRIGSMTINKTHPDYPGLKILNVFLGGYFGSRLMKNIREDKGYTYGIHSTVNSLGLGGYKVISTEVSRENIRKTINEIHREIRILQTTPVGRKELDLVRTYMAGEMVRMFDGPFAIAESFKSVWEFGLDYEYYYRLAEKIKTITPEEIQQLANAYYNIDDLYEIIAG